MQSKCGAATQEGHLSPQPCGDAIALKSVHPFPRPVESRQVWFSYTGKEKLQTITHGWRTTS